MTGEMLRQKMLEDMAGDIAALLCGRSAGYAGGVSLHTTSAVLKSRTVVQVFASTAKGSSLFSVSLEMTNTCNLPPTSRDPPGHCCANIDQAVPQAKP